MAAVGIRRGQHGCLQVRNVAQAKEIVLLGQAGQMMQQMGRALRIHRLSQHVPMVSLCLAQTCCSYRLCVCVANSQQACG